MRLSTIAFIATLAVTSFARAATPTAISVQGVLRDSMGKFQTVPVDLKVTFYDAQSGGSVLAGPYNKSSVPVANGLFSVQIDDATLASKLAGTTTGQIWMEVTAGASDVFPRQPVSAQIFALQAATADNAMQLGGVPAAGYVGIAGAQTISGAKSFSAPVVIGTAPSAPGLSPNLGVSYGGSSLVAAVFGTTSPIVVGQNDVAFNAYYDGGISNFRAYSANAPSGDINLFNGDFLIRSGAGVSTAGGTPTWTTKMTIGANGTVSIPGNLVVSGTKNFIAPHPTDPNKEILFVALEGPEAGTYCRGSAVRKGHETHIALPESFSLMTEERGLTVQVTQVGRGHGLYLARKTRGEIVVACDDGDQCPAEFDWMVHGVRKGYGGYQVIRDRGAH